MLQLKKLPRLPGTIALVVVIAAIIFGLVFWATSANAEDWKAPANQTGKAIATMHCAAVYDDVDGNIHCLTQAQLDDALAKARAKQASGKDWTSGTGFDKDCDKTCLNAIQPPEEEIFLPARRPPTCYTLGFGSTPCY